MELHVAYRIMDEIKEVIKAKHNIEVAVTLKLNPGIHSFQVGFVFYTGENCHSYTKSINVDVMEPLVSSDLMVSDILGEFYSYLQGIKLN